MTTPETNPTAEDIALAGGDVELAKRNNAALTPQPSIAIPAKASSLGRGHEEGSDADEMELPRAKLVQFTSGEAQAENKEERIDPGTIINSMTRQVLGLHFIPIFKFTNFVQWNPRKKDDVNFDAAFEPGEIVFSSTDRRDPRIVEGIKFGPNGEPPKITRYMNYLCYFLNHSMPLILSFSKTSFNAGKRLNSLTQFAGGDMFSTKYKLSVKQEERNGTKYFVLSVLPLGVALPEEFKTAEQWFNNFRGKTLKVHLDEETAVKPEEGWSE